MLARALVRERRYDAAAVLESYVAWYLSRPFDIGTTTAAALSAASRDGSPEDRLRRAREEANEASQANGIADAGQPPGDFFSQQGWVLMAGGPLELVKALLVAGSHR